MKIRRHKLFYFYKHDVFDENVTLLFVDEVDIESEEKSNFKT